MSAPHRCRPEGQPLPWPVKQWQAAWLVLLPSLLLSLLLSLPNLGRVAQAADPARPSAQFPAGNAERGKTLATVCLVCHGAQAGPMGEPPVMAPKLRWQRPPSVFYALLDYRSGRRASAAMAPYVANLSEQDMRDLSVYLAGPFDHAPPRATATDPWAVAKVASTCGFCHGETGMGVMEGYPVLAGQYPEYLQNALAAYRSGARRDPTMRSFALELNADQSRKLAAYFAAQNVLAPVAGSP